MTNILHNLDYIKLLEEYTKVKIHNITNLDIHNNTCIIDNEKYPLDLLFILDNGNLDIKSKHFIDALNFIDLHNNTIFNIKIHTLDYAEIIASIFVYILNLTNIILIKQYNKFYCYCIKFD